MRASSSLRKFIESGVSLGLSATRVLRPLPRSKLQVRLASHLDYPLKDLNQTSSIVSRHTQRSQIQGRGEPLRNEAVGCEVDSCRRSEVQIRHGERLLDGNFRGHLFVQQPLGRDDHGYSVEPALHRRPRQEI